MKKKVCIISADVILPYQPSVLNLYDVLSEHFDVEIVTFATGFIAEGVTVDNRRITYLENPGSDKRLRFLEHSLNFFAKRLARLKPFRFRFHFTKAAGLRAIRTYLQSRDYDFYIGIDADGLYPVQQLNRRGFLFSLELRPHDAYIHRVDKRRLDGLIIQSKARLDHLIPEAGVPVYYIQNAPTYVPQPLPAKRQGLLWAGGMHRSFGIFSLLDFLRAHPHHHLTLKGGVLPEVRAEIERDYAALFSSGALRIDTSYVASEDFTAYLSGFRIGVCFYAWDLIRSNFNYFTGPSGKLYAYFAAGVPVIAPDIEGMSAVREFGAGVLIKDYDPKTIESAIQAIEADYDRCVAGCLEAAKHFSFDRMSATFVNALRAQ